MKREYPEIIFRKNNGDVAVLTLQQASLLGPNEKNKCVAVLLTEKICLFEVAFIISNF